MTKNKLPVKPKQVKTKKEKEVLPISLPSDVKKIDDKYVVVFDD
jgi:hypothetical protein